MLLGDVEGIQSSICHGLTILASALELPHVSATRFVPHPFTVPLRHVAVKHKLSAVGERLWRLVTCGIAFEVSYIAAGMTNLREGQERTVSR